MRFARLLQLTFHGAVFSLLAAHSHAQQPDVPAVTAVNEQAANGGANNLAAKGNVRLSIIKSASGTNMTMSQIGEALGKSLTDECASIAQPAGNDQFLVQLTDYLDAATGIYSTSATIGLTAFTPGKPLLYPRMVYLETRVLPSGSTIEQRNSLAGEAIRAAATGLCKLAKKPVSLGPR